MSDPVKKPSPAVETLLDWVRSATGLPADTNIGGVTVQWRAGMGEPVVNLQVAGRKPAGR